MKIKLISLMTAIICILLCLGGCQPNTLAAASTSESDESAPPAPHLAYKGERTAYDINDVTLTFYGSSPYAGDKTYGYGDLPLVTYLFFANDSILVSLYNYVGEMRIDYSEIQVVYAEGAEPKNLYNTIETNPNISICKKIYSTDADNFYKKNTVKTIYRDLTKTLAEFLWCEWGEICKTSVAWVRGLHLSDIQYQFTIPSEMFTKDKGYLYFCMASYFYEDCESLSNGIRAKEGALAEKSIISIYYTKEGSKITLSSYYN